MTHTASNCPVIYGVLQNIAEPCRTLQNLGQPLITLHNFVRACVVIHTKALSGSVLSMEDRTTL